MSQSRPKSKGSTLVLNVFVMSVFALMAVIVYKSAKSMVGEAVYYERSAQAMTIAEAGLEDAMHSLYSTATWRTGFTQKSFGGGYYTVTVTTSSATALYVASSGYSPSFLFLGRAVKTVSANVVFISSTNPTNAVMSPNLTVNGTVDAYDPEVSLNPATFGDGGTVWSDSISPTSSCGSPRIFSNVIYFNTNPAPGSGCVNTPTDTVNSTTTHVTLPTHSCNAGPCQNLALIGNATIPSAYRTGAALAETFTVGSVQTLTISSGTYYFKQIKIDGTLNVDTTGGPVYLYYYNQFRESAGCQLNNLSLTPSKLLIADVGGGHQLDFACSTSLHAYVENSTSFINIHSPQALYGHLSGGVTTIDSGAKIHFDMSTGVPATLVTWTTGPSGSWTESYTRQ